MLFPVEWPGESITADWELFFSFFSGGKKVHYFVTKK